jgi:large subunit ribosomal protein L10
MSKPVKDMMVAEYRRRFSDVDSAVVVEIRGLDAEGTAALRGGLREKTIRVSIVKNTLARKAFAGTPLEALDPALKGPSALVYGGASVVDVARELVAKIKKVKQLELKAACLDGILYEGVEGVTRLGIDVGSRSIDIEPTCRWRLAPSGVKCRGVAAPLATLS